MSATARIDYRRRINLEYASASGGRLQDTGRTRTMFTVSTRRWETGTVEDTGLSAVWSCIDNTDDWWDLFDADSSSDGLVTKDSGRGRFERSDSTELVEPKPIRLDDGRGPIVEREPG